MGTQQPYVQLGGGLITACAAGVCATLVEVAAVGVEMARLAGHMPALGKPAAAVATAAAS